MAIRKNKKRIDPRYFLHETTYRDLEEGGTFHDEIKRIEQQYGVSILLRDDEGRHGVSVMHRDEDQLPGEQYPNYSKQPVSYDSLEQAEEDLKSRQAQQKMGFKEELENLLEAEEEYVLERSGVTFSEKFVTSGPPEDPKFGSLAKAKVFNSESAAKAFADKSDIYVSVENKKEF